MKGASHTFVNLIWSHGICVIFLCYLLSTANFQGFAALCGASRLIPMTSPSLRFLDSARSDGHRCTGGAVFTLQALLNAAASFPGLQPTGSSPMPQLLQLHVLKSLCPSRYVLQYVQYACIFKQNVRCIYIYGGCPKYLFPDSLQSLSQSRSNRGTTVSNRGRVCSSLIRSYT